MAWTKAASGRDVLAGVRIGLIGSSSADLDRAEANYWEVIAEDTGAILVDYADSGSRLTNTGNDATHQLDRIDELAASGEELDVLVAQPGLNDERHGVPLGAFGSTSEADFYGALDIMCRKLYDHWPLLPFGVMTGQYVNPRDAQTSAYNDAIVEVCHYYGIPVCNLWKEGRTPYGYSAWADTYAPDTLHLNDAGNRVLAPRVRAFTRTLLGY